MTVKREWLWIQRLRTAGAGNREEYVTVYNGVAYAVYMPKDSRYCARQGENVLGESEFLLETMEFCARAAGLAEGASHSYKLSTEETMVRISVPSDLWPEERRSIEGKFLSELLDDASSAFSRLEMGLKQSNYIAEGEGDKGLDEREKTLLGALERISEGLTALEEWAPNPDRTRLGAA